MILSNLMSFIKSVRYWIATSIALGFTLGLFVAFFFDPWIVSYHIKNIGSFFKIESIKSAKQETAGISEILFKDVQDVSRVRELRNMIGTANWVEKNIAPVFAISKNDIREIVDYRNNNSEKNQEIIYVNLTETGYDRERIKDNLVLSGQIFDKITGRQHCIQWLEAEKYSFQTAMRDLGYQTPELIMEISVLKDRLNTISREVEANTPAIKKSHNKALVLSGQYYNESNGIDNSINLLKSKEHDPRVYLSPDIQLIEGRIKLSQLISSYEHLIKKRAVLEYLINRSTQALNDLSQSTRAKIFDYVCVPNNYWRSDQVFESLQKDHEWKYAYLESVIGRLEAEEEWLRSNYIAILNQEPLVVYKRRFNQILVVLAGLITGVITPLVFFIINHMSEVGKSSSDSI